MPAGLLHLPFNAKLHIGWSRFPDGEVPRCDLEPFPEPFEDFPDPLDESAFEREGEEPFVAFRLSGR